MKIATWNVNSVKQRLDHLKAWLDEARPDVVCLQEIKCQTEAFPSAEIESKSPTARSTGTPRARA